MVWGWSPGWLLPRRNLFRGWPRNVANFVCAFRVDCTFLVWLALTGGGFIWGGSEYPPFNDHMGPKLDQRGGHLGGRVTVLGLEEGGSSSPRQLRAVSYSILAPPAILWPSEAGAGKKGPDTEGPQGADAAIVSELPQHPHGALPQVSQADRSPHGCLLTMTLSILPHVFHWTLRM